MWPLNGILTVAGPTELRWWKRGLFNLCSWGEEGVLPQKGLEERGPVLVSPVSWCPLVVGKRRWMEGEGRVGPRL